MPDLSLIELAGVSLATFYVAYAISNTHGPFGIFKWLKLNVPLGGLTECIVCLAPWCAALLWWLMGAVPIIVWFLAVSGAVTLAWRYTGGSHV